VCLECSHHAGWRLGDGPIMCADFSYRTSVTAGTIFDKPQTPVTVWFTACWLFATAKDEVSALSSVAAAQFDGHGVLGDVNGDVRRAWMRPRAIFCPAIMMIPVLLARRWAVTSSADGRGGGRAGWRPAGLVPGQRR
jgi:hypothetical protein